MVKDVARVKLPLSKGRSNARVVKRRTKQHPSKKEDSQMNIKQNYCIEIIK
jgi:hypothetical protein